MGGVRWVDAVGDAEGWVEGCEGEGGREGSAGAGDVD